MNSSMDLAMQHGHEYTTCTWKYTSMDTDMQHGYVYGQGARTWTWTIYKTRTCRKGMDMDMQPGHGQRADMVMQHGQQHAEWTWNNIKRIIISIFPSQHNDGTR